MCCKYGQPEVCSFCGKMAAIPLGGMPTEAKAFKLREVTEKDGGVGRVGGGEIATMPLRVEAWSTEASQITQVGNGNHSSGTLDGF